MKSLLRNKLPQFAALAHACPDVQFVLPVMGWPLDVTQTGFQTWKSDLAWVGRCENVAVKIFGLECIFGLEWTVRFQCDRNAASFV